jgi:hypothetical protein
MNAPRNVSGKPTVYWDRNDRMVRDWSTNQPLPSYEGPCLVFLDIRGPIFLKTFLLDGERHWEGMD